MINCHKIQTLQCSNYQLLFEQAKISATHKPTATMQKIKHLLRFLSILLNSKLLGWPTLIKSFLVPINEWQDNVCYIFFTCFLIPWHDLKLKVKPNTNCHSCQWIRYIFLSSLKLWHLLYVDGWYHRFLAVCNCPYQTRDHSSIS